MSSNDQKTDKIAVSIMSSWGFAEDLIRKNSIEPILAASVGWDEENDKLIYDSDIYDETTNTWKQKKTSSNYLKSLKEQPRLVTTLWISLYIYLQKVIPLQWPRT